MKTVHRTTIVGKCPHGCPDVYSAEFHIADRIITVESIQAEIDAATKEPVYQEDLTQRLANRVGCNVATVGSHGQFETECRAEPVTPPESANSTAEPIRYAVGGFSPRFTITRTDGKPCRPEARYFVMDGSGADPHAVKAIELYAKSVWPENPMLSADLLRLLGGTWPAELAQHKDAV